MGQYLPAFRPGETVTFDVSAIEASKSDTWQNYVKGTLAGLAAVKDVPCGFDGMFLGNIPLGSGLSSSAALEMCTGLALGKLYGISVDNVTLAKIGQKAEHVYIYHLIAKGTLDEKVAKVLSQKDKVQQTLLDALHR